MSPLYKLAPGGGQINDMFVVTLLENLSELEHFELHLEVQFFDWKGGIP